MPTTIEVNKQSVEALLGSGKSKPFVIPEYQRPYAWTDEQVETLFEDLWEFTATSGGTEREGSYFLGSNDSSLSSCPLHSRQRIRFPEWNEVSHFLRYLQHAMSREYFCSPQYPLAY